jgi:hypothetical protein
MAWPPLQDSHTAKRHQVRQLSTRLVETAIDYPARLQAEVAEQSFRLVGWLQGEEHEDSKYSKLLEQIERVTATLAVAA